jgi:hypothetical protein
MNEIRILIPEDELDWDVLVGANNLHKCEYGPIMRLLTRPITPEDIRSCLRMPDEWTDEEYAEHRSKCFSGNYPSAAFYAIDIALRLSPKPDPWEKMDEAIRCLHMEADRNVMAEVQKIWTALKKAEGKE